MRLPLPAQAPEGLEWEYFGPEQGMGMSFLDILQDHQGFIWLGSSNGLYRYDGYQIKPFKKYSNTPTGLSSDWIWDLEEDSAGNVWIATYDGGLHQWERSSGRVIQFSHESGNPQSLRSNNVLKILIDTAGQVWAVVKTAAGAPVLDRLDPTTGIVTHYGFHPGKPGSLSCDTVSITAFQAMQLSPLYQGPEGNVWVATENGLNLYGRKTDGFRQFRHETGNPNSLPFKKVLAIEASKKEAGFYWVRTASPGLEHIALSRLNASTGAVETVKWGGGAGLEDNCLGLYLSEQEGEAWLSGRRLEHFRGDGFSARSRQIVLEAEDADAKLPAGLFRHSSGRFLLPLLGVNPLHAVRASDNHVSRDGIFFYDSSVGQPFFIGRNPTDNDNIFGEVYSIMEDRSGIIWLGCSRGFYKLQLSGSNASLQPVFENYYQKKPGQEGLLSTDIRAVFEESSNVFWLATYGGGLARLDRRDRAIRHFVHSATNPNSIGSDNVYALWHDARANQLWIGHEKGIDILSLDNLVVNEPSTAVFRRLRDDASLLDGRVNELEPDGRGNLWVGTAENGLLLWGPDAGKVLKEVSFKKKNPDPAHSTFINKVFLDSKGHTWVAPGMGGLCRLIPKGDSFDYECFLDGLYIVDFFEASDGRLWCAAMNYGLLKFDPQTETYELANMENRLSRNSVLGIEADRLGRIWFTSVGLTRYNPWEDTYKVYGQEAGVIGLDPERCFFKSSSGELFYAAPNSALQIFRPELVLDNPVTPKAVITGFKLFNETVTVGEESPLKENIEVASEIHLNHSQHSFSLEFAGLEFTNPQGNQFRYRMRGADEAWVFSGTHREARYNALPPGRYTFEVQAANSDGVWSTETAAIAIIVHPPWWNRWWAYMLFGILLLAPVFLVLQYQFKRKAALEEARRLKEIDQLKTRLYTNITHEFRTPLTVILGMAEQVLRQPDKWFREGLDMVIRNGQNLLNLVNQMLEMNKIESGEMKVNLRLGDVATFVKYTTESFHSFAESKGVGLHFLSPLEELKIDYDEDKILRILSNLLSNAIKYTPEGGNVYVMVDCIKRGDKELLEIRVKDTGIGIPAEEQGRIFERFYSLPIENLDRHSNGEGALGTFSSPFGRPREGAVPPPKMGPEGAGAGAGIGIGLALAMELVKLLDGGLSVQSRPRKGSEFTVHLPVSRSATEKHAFREEQVGLSAGRPSAAEPALLAAEHSLNGDCRGKPIALVIEDNRDVVRYLRTCLEGDYCVEAAYNGQAGIEAAIELVPDIIISDVMMPEKDGFEVTDTLKKDERTSHIPIILLTARATDEDRIAGLERGADAYLAKPFHRDELRVRMQKMIELRQRLQERYASFVASPVPSDPALELEDNFVRKIRELVEAHLDDPDFGVDEISESIFLSRTQVHRKLKALTGLSTGHFIRSIRLDHALQLLRATGKSITEIAMDVGFKDHAYFSRVFSAEYGKAPSEMRG